MGSRTRGVGQVHQWGWSSERRRGWRQNWAEKQWTAYASNCVPTGSRSWTKSQCARANKIFTTSPSGWRVGYGLTDV